MQSSEVAKFEMILLTFRHLAAKAPQVESAGRAPHLLTPGVAAGAGIDSSWWCRCCPSCSRCRPACWRWSRTCPASC
ncbi:MAG: hypothetical protein ACLVJH_05930 [Faecalibacterium prausnitzii]